MGLVTRTAGTAGSIALKVKNGAGQSIVPVSVPVVRWYSDAARTLGEVTLPVTGAGSDYTATWTAAQAPAVAATRYLKVTIEVSTGIFDTDADDEVAFSDAVAVPIEIEGWIAAADLRCTAAVPADATKAIAVATTLLHALSGYRVGRRTVTVRPVRVEGSPVVCAPLSPVGYGPPPSSRSWPLPGPVASVASVIVDGAVVTDYRLVGNTLYRTDASWPANQDLGKATTEKGTWAVTYTRGVEPDEAARAAVGALACELLKGWEGGECRLPQRVTTITRQGVTVALTDPMDLFDKGRTGIAEVDLWIASVNPANLRRPPSVSYPGSKTTRRTA